ncbi:MAG TPA: CU044_2847 family protein [Pseudonocardiaceae bacterium]|nr:CU044_2847 family protein [Pseudonocardiaceae bacterium]
MDQLVEFTFDDGTAVLVSTFPVPGQGSGADVPEGSDPVAVGRPGRVVVQAGRTLRQVLRPLVPVLHAVHETVSTMESHPNEVTVELGVKLTQDLRLGIVSAGGEASMVVSAKWTLKADQDADT